MKADECITHVSDVAMLSSEVWKHKTSYVKVVAVSCENLV